MRQAADLIVTVTATDCPTIAADLIVLFFQITLIDSQTGSSDLIVTVPNYFDGLSEKQLI